MASTPSSGKENIPPSRIPVSAAPSSPSTEIFAEELTEMVEAVVAFRFAGVQCRLYPEHVGPQQRAVQAAITALNRAMSVRHFLTLSRDGADVAVNGLVLSQRDVMGANRDIVSWLEAGHLRAIGFLPGVSEDELRRFLQVLIRNESLGQNAALAPQIADLGLTVISVVPKSVSSDVPLKTALIEFNPSFGMAVAGLELPQQAIPEIAPGSDRARELLAALMHAPAPGEPTPEEPARKGSAAKKARTALDLSVASTCQSLIEEIDNSAVPERRSLMVVLSHWLRSREPNEIPPVLLEHLEGVLRHSLERETDAGVIRSVAVMIEHRLQVRMDAHEWESIRLFVTPVLKRLDDEREPEIHGVLSGIPERTSAWAVGQAMLLPADTTSEGFDPMRPLFTLLGERPLHLMINRLKTSNRMEERFRLLRILREMGQGHVGLLIRELRANNPWYVYRNMLQVLADVGTEEALGAISEKVRYHDPRVRAMAVTAAVEIAHQQATPYLVQGLEDGDPDVRARAASLAGYCPQPRILQLLIRMLQTSRFEKEEPVPVQLAACTALGLFAADEARDALLLILRPPLFSGMRKKNFEVRAAAATALANYLPHPAVTEALQWAAREHHPLINQAAQRALGQQDRVASG